MEVLARYVHGSADSQDCDVIYIVDELPSFQEQLKFCKADPLENSNIAIVRNGVVTKCFKGFPDEVNNSVLATYSLHFQKDELLIKRSVPRDVVLKQLSVLRKLLMELRHTNLRHEGHIALRSNYLERIQILQSVDYRTLEWTLPENEKKDRKKSIAFQLGQAIALSGGKELYTKSDLSKTFPVLRPFLYREPCDMAPINELKDAFLSDLKALGLQDCGNCVVCHHHDGLSRYISIRGKEQEVEKP